MLMVGVKDIAKYIEECHKETIIYDGKEPTYNENYYRGVNHAYKHLLGYLKNQHTMYSWAWRHKYLGYFSRKWELKDIAKEYRKRNPVPERPNVWVIKIKAWLKRRRENKKKEPKKKGCPECGKSKNIRYVKKGTLKCTKCNIEFNKGNKK